MAVQDPAHRLAVRGHRRSGRADGTAASDHPPGDRRSERGPGDLPAGPWPAPRSRTGSARPSEHPAAGDGASGPGGACAMIRLPAMVAASVRRRGRPAWARRLIAFVAVAALLAACDGGGSGQSGSAFTFLSVDGFSLTAGNFVSSVPSSTVPGRTTTACVTLRNNLKNPTVTASTALDNIVVTSYTVTITSLTGGS